MADRNRSTVDDMRQANAMYEDGREVGFIAKMMGLDVIRVANLLRIFRNVTPRELEQLRRGEISMPELVKIATDRGYLV